MDENIFEIETEELEENPVPEKEKKDIKKELIEWGKTLLFYCVLPLLVQQPNSHRFQ